MQAGPRDSPAAGQKRKSSMVGSHAGDSPASGEAKVVKTGKACLNCRKQKMKCELDGDPPCKRCRNARTPCMFKVRANGIDAGDWFLSDLINPPANQSLEEFRASVLARLDAIEARLGMQDALPKPAVGMSGMPNGGQHEMRSGSAEDEIGDEEETKQIPSSLPDLEVPLRALISQNAIQHHEAWSTEVVESLWMAFAEHMPSFHFSTQRVFLDRPTPLLLAAILYASATQHPMTHFARHAPFYQNVVARAIAELCIPKQEAAAFRNQVEEYHNALGVVIAGLMCNASVATTGLWISMAYQMIVHGSEAGSGVKSSEWRGLYEGLRVIDIEHASLRMTCPLLPLSPPLASLEQSSSTTHSRARAWNNLTTIMHVGLSHFSGRNLPNVMEIVLGIRTGNLVARDPSEADMRMIMGWAGELDAWLLRYRRPTRKQERGVNESNIALLQYQLHKLFVLSIYSSITGCEMFRSRSSHQHNELLAAARGALQLQRMGMSVWSNWDLVIITLAAMIVIDNMPLDPENAREDRLLVQGHIHALRSTQQPAPNLRLDMATRLEARMSASSSPLITTSSGARLPMNTHPSQLGDLPLAPPLENTQPFFMTPPEVQSTVPFIEPHATGLGDWMSSAEFAISQNEGALPTWPSALQRMMGGVLDGTQEDWNQFPNLLPS